MYRKPLSCKPLGKPVISAGIVCLAAAIQTVSPRFVATSHNALRLKLYYLRHYISQLGSSFTPSSIYTLSTYNTRHLPLYSRLAVTIST